MSEQTIARALSVASESDKAEFAHFIADHALPDDAGAQTVRAIVAACDRFVAERLKEAR